MVEFVENSTKSSKSQEKSRNASNVPNRVDAEAVILTEYDVERNFRYLRPKS